MPNITAELTKVTSLPIKYGFPLSNVTTLRIGGPADAYIEVSSREELKEIILYARKLGVPVTILGGGSNVVVSDKGIRGLVIKNKISKISVKGNVAHTHSPDVSVAARWQSDASLGTFRGVEFRDLDYDETDCPRVEVSIESGAILQSALNSLIKKGITGLQWYSGIPGTLGGAVFNNIHGGTHFISEVLKSVTILDSSGIERELKLSDVALDYDKSRFHNNSEIILEATLALYEGDSVRALYTANEWLQRKSKQPRNSPGCSFRNITNDERIRLGYPTTSTGYIVEHVLHMSGHKVGGASVSEANHNFIVNNGGATSSDFISIARTIKSRIKNELGIDLYLEIVPLGFEREEIQDLYLF